MEKVDYYNLILLFLVSALLINATQEPTAGLWNNFITVSQFISIGIAILVPALFLFDISTTVFQVE